MFGARWLAMVAVGTRRGRDVSGSHAGASVRGAEVANLKEVNGLIIRRRRTGVLLVDRSGFVRRANEAAMMLLGDIDLVVDGKPRNVRDFAPELATRLAAWRKDDVASDIPILLDGDEQAEVLPRFARLLVEGETPLVFLHDPSMVSRRAAIGRAPGRERVLPYV